MIWHVFDCRVNPCDYYVQLGENTLIGASSDIQIIQLDRIIRHKDYSGNSKALYKLSLPNKFIITDKYNICSEQYFHFFIYFSFYEIQRMPDLSDLPNELWRVHKLLFTYFSINTYWCLYRHLCILPERFGKNDRLVRCIAKDVTSRHKCNVMSQTPVVSQTTRLILVKFM